MAIDNKRKIWIRADAQLNNGVQNITDTFFKGNDVDFRVNYEHNEALYDDLSNVTSSTLEIKDAATEGANVIMTKTVTSFNTSATQADLSDEEDSQATFSFSKAETNQTAGTYYIIISILHDDTTELTYLKGTIKLVDDGFSGSAGSPPATGDTYLTEDQSDSRYAFQPVYQSGTIASPGNQEVSVSTSNNICIANYDITGTAGTYVLYLTDFGAGMSGPAICHLLVTLPTTASIVVEIRNGTSGGTLLDTITTNTSGDDYACDLFHPGTSAGWKLCKSQYPNKIDVST